MHTTAGPLQPSRALLELLRLVRATGKFLEPNPSLDVGVVNSIETELRATLPDDALILMALRDPDLSCASGLDIDDVPEAEDWGDDLPDDHVAIAHLYHDPFAERDEGAHGGDSRSIAILRSGDAASPKILVDGTEETTIAELVHETYTEWLRQKEEIISVLARVKELPLDDGTFKPALTGKIEVKTALPERTVAHPKFGRGKVVEEKTDAGDLKLVIDFESAGRKILLAKFVVDA
jgi:hypothetical protein